MPHHNDTNLGTPNFNINNIKVVSCLLVGSNIQGVSTNPLQPRSKSRKENPQKPTQLSSRSHPRHLVGKRTAQKTPS